MTETMATFYVQGANELDDENGERFQVRVQQMPAVTIVAAGAPTPPSPPMVGFVIPLDFPIDAAADMKAAGVKRGAVVKIAGLTVVPPPAKA